MYAWQPEGEPQIGLVNAVWTGLGNEPVPWLQVPPLNTLALIVIMIWLQTGFAMVMLSAALKGVPSEVIEAARMDGAGEASVFFRIVVPMIRGTLIAVATTISIAILKVFDIVYVTTGGRFETEVLANRMFSEMFSLPELRDRQRDRGDPVHRRHPDHGRQHPEPATPGDRVVTAGVVVGSRGGGRAGPDRRVGSGCSSGRSSASRWS